MGTKLVPIDNQPQGVGLLASREIDGLAMGAPSNTYNEMHHTGFQLIDVHEFAQEEGLRFPLRAGNETLLSTLNEFINQAQANGEIQSYYERWMAGGL